MFKVRVEIMGERTVDYAFPVEIQAMAFALVTLQDWSVFISKIGVFDENGTQILGNFEEQPHRVNLEPSLN